MQRRSAKYAKCVAPSSAEFHKCFKGWDAAFPSMCWENGLQDGHVQKCMHALVNSKTEAAWSPICANHICDSAVHCVCVVLSAKSLNNDRSWVKGFHSSPRDARRKNQQAAPY